MNYSQARGKKASGVYEIVNLINGKRYIGSSVHCKSRWGDHRRALIQGRHHCVALQRAHDKYGPSAFEFRVLLICEPKNLVMFEQKCLDGLTWEYNSSPTAGNTLGIKHSTEARARMSAGQLKRGPRSMESRAKVSRALLGKKKSPEHAAKIGAAKRGTKASPELRLKLSLAHMGISKGPHTHEHRARISASLKGRPCSPERREAIRVAMNLRQAQRAT